MRKVLYVLHNHPANSPGGMEIVGYQLYQAVREAGEFEPIFLARVGPPQTMDNAHEGTRFALAGEDPNQYYFHTSLDEFDRVLWTARDKRLYTEDWRGFLLALEPDVMHFRHALMLGYDLIRETKSTLPHVPIVYTLHDFVPICHHNGQMVRTKTSELCYASSPQRCHECFPGVPVQTFFLRERFVKSAFELVDLFIAPSEFLRRRYIEWGIPSEKIRYEDTGLVITPPLADPPDAGRRRRIGFFGRIWETKGLDVLLEAMKILNRENARVQLLVRGTGLERSGELFRDNISRLLEETSGSVLFTGRYDQAELPGLMSAVDWVIVPSIWWEVGPNSIREAMMHRRPVICSDIGSMADRVTDGMNGLHFNVGDPHSLADTIRRAVDNPGLWDELRGQLSDPHPMDQHLETITAIYEELLASARVHAGTG